MNKSNLIKNMGRFKPSRNTLSLVDDFTKTQDVLTMSQSTNGYELIISYLSNYAELVSSVKLSDISIQKEDILKYEIPTTSRLKSLPNSITSAANSGLASNFYQSQFTSLPSTKSASDIDLLKSAHKLVMANFSSTYGAGKFRNDEVILKLDNRKVHSYSKAKNINKEMSQWSERYQRSNSHDEHPLIRAGMAHLELLQIHPFGPGNDRTARAAIQGFLREDKMSAIPLSLIFEEKKDEYFSVMAESFNEEKPDKFIDFFCKSSSEAINFMKEAKRELISGNTKILKIISPILNDHKKSQMTSYWILADPFFTTNVISKRARIPLDKSEEAISRLEKEGLLKKLQSGNETFYCNLASLRIMKRDKIPDYIKQTKKEVYRH